MKNIVLCADDFGLTKAIDEGIVALLKTEKLNAVSCMTNEKYWQEDASSLKPFLSNAKIGLHFNVSYPFFPFFILRCYLRCVNRKKILDNLTSQFNAFISAMGRKPDFIDGHQHIHQLPVIHEVIIQFFKENYHEEGFIRNTANTQKNCFKAKLINVLGGRAFKKLLEKNNIPHNKHFSGIYNLSEKNDYAALLKIFMQDVRGDGLIMCHPAIPDQNNANDFRGNEFNILLNAKTF